MSIWILFHTFPVGGTIWVGLGVWPGWKTVLLEGRWPWRFQRLHHSQFAFSLLYACGSRCELAASYSSRYSCCLLPHSPSWQTLNPLEPQVQRNSFYRLPWSWCFVTANRKITNTSLKHGSLSFWQKIYLHKEILVLCEKFLQQMLLVVLKFFVCIWVCIYLCVHTQSCAHLFRGKRLTLDVFLYNSPSYFLRQSCSLVGNMPI